MTVFNFSLSDIIITSDYRSYYYSYNCYYTSYVNLCYSGSRWRRCIGGCCLRNFLLLLLLLLLLQKTTVSAVISVRVMHVSHAWMNARTHYLSLLFDLPQSRVQYLLCRIKTVWCDHSILGSSKRSYSLLGKQTDNVDAIVTSFFFSQAGDGDSISRSSSIISHSLRNSFRRWSKRGSRRSRASGRSQDFYRNDNAMGMYMTPLQHSLSDI